MTIHIIVKGIDCTMPTILRDLAATIQESTNAQLDRENIRWSSEYAYEIEITKTEE